jgi:hypothetical protein
MTDHPTQLRRRFSARQSFIADDERSMRWLELGMAITALAAAVLLAFAR